MKFLSVRNGASGPLELNYSNWGLPRIIKKMGGPSPMSSSAQACQLTSAQAWDIIRLKRKDIMEDKKAIIEDLKARIETLEG